jgi:hypothetical protein
MRATCSPQLNLLQWVTLIFGEDYILRMGAGGPFPGCKAQSGRDADHTPPSSAEVVNE